MICHSGARIDHSQSTAVIWKSEAANGRFGEHRAEGGYLAMSLANVWSTFEPAVQGPQSPHAHPTAAALASVLPTNVRSGNARASAVAELHYLAIRQMAESRGRTDVRSETAGTERK